MTDLSIAIQWIGGPIPAAKICGIKRQAVDKWLVKGALPRTEYTGETSYASKLAEASAGKFTAEWLLKNAAPNNSNPRPHQTAA